MKLPFFGGVHPDGHKGLSAAAPLAAMPPPARVAIPLRQHIGAPCKPLVKAGDAVRMGQKIGDGEGLCVPVHASVSGVVEAIEDRPHQVGTDKEAPNQPTHSRTLKTEKTGGRNPGPLSFHVLKCFPAPALKTLCPAGHTSDGNSHGCYAPRLDSHRRGIAMERNQPLAPPCTQAPATARLSFRVGGPPMGRQTKTPL